MRELGVDRLMVSKIRNHTVSGVTRIYDRYAADPEKAPRPPVGQQTQALVSGEEGKVVALRS